MRAADFAAWLLKDQPQWNRAAKPPEEAAFFNQAAGHPLTAHMAQ
jgi:hypothetical protein